MGSCRDESRGGRVAGGAAEERPSRPWSTCHAAGGTVLTILLLAGAGRLGAQPPDGLVRQWQEDYRHLHKSQAVAASQQRFAAMVAPCQAMLKDYPQDGESLFFLALAQAQQGQSAEARQTLQRAVSAGVPPARFLTAPRTWNQALWEDEALADFRRLHQDRLAQGPMLGALSDSSVHVWVRSARPMPLTLRLGTRADAAPPDFELTQTTNADQDGTTVFRVDGLQADTRYFYDVVTPAGRHFGDPLPSFRTAPTRGRATRLTFAFGGGAAYTPRFERMWQTIARCQPQLLLLLGDNVYIDDPEDRNYQRYLYHRRQAQPGFRELVARSCVYAIWDDHDFGVNDCLGGPEIEVPVWKRQVWDVFRQNWANPAYGGGPPQPGVWFQAQYGDVEFFFLDGRYYRHTATDPDQASSMLGPVQKRWLLDALGRSTARIKFLVSPVPWVGGNADKWNGFADERQEIFSYLAQQAIRGVVLLSADRHRSDLLVTRRPGAYDLYELMSSKLTNHHTHAEIDQRDGAIFSYNQKCSFGLVTVDTRADDAWLSYRIYSIDGELVYEFRLSGSALGDVGR